MNKPHKWKVGQRVKRVLPAKYGKKPLNGVIVQCVRGTDNSDRGVNGYYVKWDNQEQDEKPVYYCEEGDYLQVEQTDNN